jgi:nucleotide-binding universal stress UspA family protein
MAQKSVFQSILFPVDFSKMSEAAAPYVRGLAQLTGANVTPLHVVPWLSARCSTTEVHPAIPGDQDLRDLVLEQAVRLEKFRERYFDDVASRSSVKSGAVADSITDAATDNGTDLIMMPTRGLGPSRRFLIGSTTEQVLHDAPCAVWTSPHLHELAPFVGFHHLLCTIERDNLLPEFLKEAVRLAACFGSKLSFVTASRSIVGRPAEERRVGPLNKEYPQADLHDELGREVDCMVYIETGPVAGVVRRLVEEQNIDLVVTNRGHLLHPFGKLRTHAYEIVMESPCPVLSLCMTANRRPEAREYAALQFALA